MLVAIDTNILAYAEGVNGDALRMKARAILVKLPRESVVIPVQVLGELFNVLVKKAGRASEDARQIILNWQDGLPSIETTDAVMTMAVDLAATHRVGIWDAVILCAAASAGCRVLLSEDLQDGFTWGGVTVVNPFASTPHELLADLLETLAPN